MLFNSYEFIIFFTLIFAIYWLIPVARRKVQNLLLVAASCAFYAFWDWRFVSLLLFSAVLNFAVGLNIHRAVGGRRKIWLYAGVAINAGILCFFKYYNFFIDSLSSFAGDMGITVHLHTLHIILPIGISFYTFHGLSYIFDIYNKKIEPSPSLIDYTLFTSFFPLLVAGPIERATNLLPQISTKRHFDLGKAVDGCRQILWGMFKKVVIADNCARYVDMVYAEQNSYGSIALATAMFLFAIQIYADFSGYTDIALGTARLLGFELLQNFRFPYFARNMAELWRRWHISLTSWFRDYLYIPLGGSRRSKLITTRNILVTFAISGLWHGANTTFVIWGLLNAVLVLPYVLYKPKASGSKSMIRNVVQMFVTFTLFSFTFIFFRAQSLDSACAYITDMLSTSGGNQWLRVSYTDISLLLFFVVVEWMGRNGKHALETFVTTRDRALRWAVYYIILFLVWQNIDSGRTFIYFQF